MARFRESAWVLFGCAALAGTAGCEVQKCETDDGKDATCLKSEKRYEGAAVEPDALPYTPGTDLTVHGVYGKIRVVEGNSGEVGVTFEPFTYRAYDAEAAARDELENKFDYVFEDTGSILAASGRHDSTNGLGADITLRLPPEFDGALVLNNDSDGPLNPGDVNASYVASAVSVEVSTQSLGDCTVAGAPSVAYTKARCDGTITVKNVVDQLDLASKGLGGGIVVTLADITADSPGGSVRSEDGDVSVTFPSGASFAVQAQSSTEGEVKASTLDDACTGDAAAKTAKSYTCGDGGPTYVVTAGTNGVGPSSVNLKY